MCGVLAMAKDKKVAPKGQPDKSLKLKNKDYLEQLRRLHVELVKLQEWVKQNGIKVCIVFEGRDGAGKGGTIKALTERVSPRVFRVVALPAPTDREKSQMYVQRYLPHLPAAGEVVIFDRSWYNRAGVERVMGFCTDEQVKGFLKTVPQCGACDRRLGRDSPQVLAGSQFRGTDPPTRGADQGRAQNLEADPMDLKSYSRWYDYSRARDDMFKASDTQHAPWYVTDSNDKRRARLNIISDLLSRIPYKDVPREKVILPKRQKPGGYREPDYPFRRIPEKF
jgi:polyphosphate kinase 2